MMFSHPAEKYAQRSPVLLLRILYASWANEFFWNFLDKWAFYVLANIRLKPMCFFWIFFHLSLGHNAKNWVQAVSSCSWLSNWQGIWSQGTYEGLEWDGFGPKLAPAPWVLVNSSSSEPLSQLNWELWGVFADLSFIEPTSGSSVMLPSMALCSMVQKSLKQVKVSTQTGLLKSISLWVNSLLSSV